MRTSAFPSVSTTRRAPKGLTTGTTRPSTLTPLACYCDRFKGKCLCERLETALCIEVYDLRTDQQKQPSSPHVGAYVNNQVLDYVDAQFRCLYAIDDIIMFMFYRQVPIRQRLER